MEFLNRLSTQNNSRYPRFNHLFVDKNEEMLFLSTAVGGETGELLNIVKKIRRGDNIPFSDFCDEVGDIVCYLDLLCTHMGTDLRTCITEKFNKVSEKRNMPERL